MAPDVKGNFDAAERRRQMIQESKFLGGDMEHTHLVKGKAENWSKKIFFGMDQQKSNFSLIYGTLSDGGR